MPVRRKARAGNDPVLVDDAKRAKAHLRRIPIIREGKSVAALEPAGSALAARHAIAKLDHRRLLLLAYVGSGSSLPKENSDTPAPQYIYWSHSAAGGTHDRAPFW